MILELLDLWDLNYFLLQSSFSLHLYILMIFKFWVFQHHVVSLTQQIEQFQSVCENITEIYGDDDIASKLVANAFYLISVGSNDFFDQFRYNYNISAPELITYLSDTFANHLQVKILLCSFPSLKSWINLPFFRPSILRFSVGKIKKEYSWMQPLPAK